MKTIKIYTLDDPITGYIKYVGKTTSPLTTRLSAHIYEALKRNTKSYRCSWIKHLNSKNLKPTINLLDEIQYTSDWEWLEQYWISQIKTWGFKITNLTDGGDGNKGQIFSKETIEKRKISIKKKIDLGLIDYKNRGLKSAETKRNRNYTISTETKQKLREFNLGKKQSKESILKRSKAVIQLDKNNRFIQQWESLREAARQLNISVGAIQNVCSGRAKTAGGFKWKYKNKDIVEINFNELIFCEYVR